MMSHQPLPASQRGAVLITSLIFLVMLTVVAVVATQSTVLETRMSTNAIVKARAVESSEALRTLSHELIATSCYNHGWPDSITGLTGGTVREDDALFSYTTIYPVSLIGGIFLMQTFGFTLNLLTLLAIVLSVGLVVDDAIVVLENIQRQRTEGMRARAAAVIGTRQVFFAVVATTAVLVSVFVPISFLGGTTGMLFREFGLVLASAVIISSFVALSLVVSLAIGLFFGVQPARRASLLFPIDALRADARPQDAYAASKAAVSVTSMARASESRL